tara:strand:- start:261 stop:518 length:258 start_codon:yes stop_codon:yes gene_type:complete
VGAAAGAIDTGAGVTDTGAGVMRSPLALAILCVPLYHANYKELGCASRKMQSAFSCTFLAVGKRYVISKLLVMLRSLTLFNFATP